MQITRIHCNHPNYADYAVYLNEQRIWFCFVAQESTEEQQEGYVEVYETGEDLSINGVVVGKKLVLDKEGNPKKVQLFGHVRIIRIAS